MPPRKKEDIDVADGFAELEAITAWFERGEANIDEGLGKFERAMAIATVLRKRLAEAENKMTEIRASYESSLQ
jgi:exodeoxyribonuclease VII small subunit